MGNASQVAIRSRVLTFGMMAYFLCAAASAQNLSRLIQSLAQSDATAPTASAHRIAVEAPRNSQLALGENTEEDSARQASEEGLAPRALVLHAGAAVQFTIPAAWHVQEVGVGRQVRLLISPQPVQPTAVDVTDGLWVALEYRPHGLPAASQDDLQRQLSRELAESYSEDALSMSYQRFEIDGHPAVAADFDLEPGGGQKVAYRCRQVLVQTGWCRCRVHMVSPRALAASRFAQWHRILAGLRLVKPNPEPAVDVSPVSDAQAILGSWKARGSRLRLSGDGSITVVTDKPFSFTSTNSTEPQLGKQVTGRFRARGDVLYIQWEDESKLNYRWRLHQDRLMMTDHQGRTTQLARISE